MSKKTEEKSLSIIETNSVAAIVPDLFGDINVEDLNQQIDVLGKNSGELTDGEKNSAVSIIHEWEDVVIDRINRHNRDMVTFVNYLSNAKFGEYNAQDPTCPDIITKEQSEELAKTTDTLDIYTAMGDAYTAWYEYTTTEEPQKVDFDINDPDITKTESALRVVEYNTKYEQFRIQSSRLKHKVIKTEKQWKNALKSHPETAELIQRIRKYSNTIGKVHDQCRDKGRSARMSIAISNEEVRTALRGMDEFVHTIGRL